MAVTILYIVKLLDRHTINQDIGHIFFPVRLCLEYVLILFLKLSVEGINIRSKEKRTKKHHTINNTMLFRYDLNVIVFQRNNHAVITSHFERMVVIVKMKNN